MASNTVAMTALVVAGAITCLLLRRLDRRIVRGTPRPAEIQTWEGEGGALPRERGIGQAQQLLRAHR